MSDNTFTRHGITWTRHWVGDNGGLYVWRAEGRRLEAWQVGWDRTRRVGTTGDAIEDITQQYHATVDGRVVGRAGKLRDVMDAATLAWMRDGGRRAA